MKLSIPSSRPAAERSRSALTLKSRRCTATEMNHPVLDYGFDLNNFQQTIYRYVQFPRSGWYRFRVRCWGRSGTEGQHARHHHSRGERHRDPRRGRRDGGTTRKSTPCAAGFPPAITASRCTATSRKPPSPMTSSKSFSRWSAARERKPKLEATRSPGSRKRGWFSLSIGSRSKRKHPSSSTVPAFSSPGPMPEPRSRKQPGASSSGSPPAPGAGRSTKKS